MNMNEKLIKTIIEPVYDEMESPDGLSNFDDLLRALQGEVEEMDESFDPDLFNSTTDLLFLGDLDSYKVKLNSIKRNGMLTEYIQWCKDNLDCDESDLKLDILDECDGGGAVANGGGFAQLGTAPTAAGTTFLGMPVEGKSVKKKRKKLKEEIEVGKEYTLRDIQINGEDPELIHSDNKYLVLDIRDELVKCKDTNTGEIFVFYQDMFVDGDNNKPTIMTKVR